MKFDGFFISTRTILEEALSREIKVTEISYANVCKMEFNKHIEYIYSICSSKTDAVAHFICKNKDIAKDFFSGSGLSIAEGGVFEDDQLEDAVEFCQKRGLWPIVVKPMSGAGGKSVFTKIENIQELKDIWCKVTDRRGKKIVEKYFVGSECRVLVTRDKVLAAVRRIPANVTGDGQKTIAQLIEQKNSDPRREDCREAPIVKIRPDEIMKLKLKNDGLDFNSIPKKDELIYLRNNSNISTGGDSYDITEEIHPSMGEIALKAINAIPGLAYAGVDIISRDYKSEQNSDSYIVIEINANPGIDMHHFPYHGKPRNVAKGIVDVIFPETKKD